MTLSIPDRSLLETYFVKNMAIRGWDAEQVVEVMFSNHKKVHVTDNDFAQSSFIDDVYAALQNFKVWQANDRWNMSHDLPLLAYLCWTSQEKINLNPDTFGRYKAKDVEQRFDISVEVPYLDLALKKLEKVLQNLHVSKKIPVYADSWWFTSDIDYIYQTWKQALRHVFFERNWIRLIAFAKDFISCTIKSQPYVYWHSHPRALDIKPTFFILPEKTFLPDYDSADYDVSSAAFKSIIQLILSLWSNVCFGYHVGFKAKDERAFAIPYRELRQQNYPISPIVRHHFLRYDLIKTPEIWEKLGIKLDSTFSYPDKIGFYNATCHPFYVFDIKRQHITQVLEMPLCLMDSTLLYSHYMFLEEKAEIESAVKKLLHTVLQVQGVFVVNLHPNNYSSYDHPKYRFLFESILNHVENTGCKSLDIRDLMRVESTVI